MQLIYNNKWRRVWPWLINLTCRIWNSYCAPQKIPFHDRAVWFSFFRYVNGHFVCVTACCDWTIRVITCVLKIYHMWLLRISIVDIIIMSTLAYHESCDWILCLALNWSPNWFANHQFSEFTIAWCHLLDAGNHFSIIQGCLLHNRMQRCFIKMYWP